MSFSFGTSFGSSHPADKGEKTIGFSFGNNSSSNKSTLKNSKSNSTTAASSERVGNPGGKQAKIIAFDPQNPACLLIPSSKDSSNQKNGVGGGFERHLSDVGIGCNPFEISALMKLLDAREDEDENKIKKLRKQHFHDTEDEDMMYVSFSDDITTARSNSIRLLSCRYRQSIQDCLNGWEDKLLQSNEEKDETDVEEDDDTNIELLKITNAIHHLLEIFLLSTNSSTNEMPGSLTADTVRFLRFHQMPDPIDIVQDTIFSKTQSKQIFDLEELLSSPQPEFYLESMSDMTTGSTSTSLAPYWLLIKILTTRGCLADVWAMLSRHSAFRRCASNDTDNYDPMIQQDRQAFAIIRDILLSAPLPGGTDGTNDDGLHILKKIQEKEDQDQNIVWMSGVSPSSCKLWDIPSKHDISSTSNYNVHAAFKCFRTWKNSIINALESNTSLRNLTRRIPNLKDCLWNILIGQGQQKHDYITWSEVLISELLYQRPNIRKEDIYIRTRSAMKACNIDHTRGTESILLKVMQGNTGQAIQALHSFGGSSGAALPSTLTALLCDLLIDANRIKPEKLPFDLQTELVLAASSSILSSFALQSHVDVGVRLSVRLLLTQIQTKNNDRVIHNIAEILDRHWPKTDAETKGLLGLVKNLVERGSRPIADSCESLARSRYQHYIATNQPANATSWLLRGIEFTSLLPLTKSSAYPTSYKGTCFRNLVELCNSSIQSMLESLTKFSSLQSRVKDNFEDGFNNSDEDTLVERMKKANDIISAITDYHSTNLVEQEPPIILLQYVLKIGFAVLKSDDKEAAVNIISCIEDKSIVCEGDDECMKGGPITTLAHPSEYSFFLSLAYDILVKENESFLSEEENLPENSNVIFESAFNVESIHVLLTRFTQLYSPEYGLTYQNFGNDKKPMFQEEEMRKALCDGLMRGFVSENESKRILCADSITGNEIPMNSYFGRVNETDYNLEFILGPSM